MAGKTTMTIDPGISGTGYALWSEKMILLDAGIFSSRNKGWLEKAEDIASQLKVYMVGKKVTQAHIELPSFFQSSGGETVARRGDLVKLTLMAGLIHGTFKVLGCRVKYVSIANWKGQLPKNVVEKRVRKRVEEDTWNGLDIKSHAIDAVGIGLYVKGEL